MTAEILSPNVKAGIQVRADINEAFGQILTPPALSFIFELHQRFEKRRRILLNARKFVQETIENGTPLSFIAHTAHIRNSDWKVAPVPENLQDRRVEITGPVDRKMMINALNSGAKVFMADFEDSNSPGWFNTMQGQINLRDAVRKTISYTNEAGKEYTLQRQTATLMVRPRGWHLHEKHVWVNGEPMSASLFDFGLYFFHNAHELLKQGSGTYFYLPKMEHYNEAQLWDEVFTFSEQYVGIPHGTIKATVLIETILAAFQMHEILWALKDHSAGLNCGRWDYIFSFIKKFRNVPGYLFPERSQITMTAPFMRAYTQLLVQTCHKRGIHAIGGMAAQIPIKNDEKANQEAFAKVKADKEREANDGHDGTWVAHPGLVAVAKEAFDRIMPEANQIASKPRTDFTCDEHDLLALPKGTITEEGLRTNINVGILYIESWLRGNGAAALYNLMEDAATAEISRTQVWQWLHSKAVIINKKNVTPALYKQIRNEEIEKIRTLMGNEGFAKGRFKEAIDLFDNLVLNEHFEEFLTVPAYQLIEF